MLTINASGRGLGIVQEMTKALRETLWTVLELLGGRVLVEGGAAGPRGLRGDAWTVPLGWLGSVGGVIVCGAPRAPRPGGRGA